MSLKVSCIYCDGDLNPLPESHQEYVQLYLTYDGTRRWFECENCEGVFAKDKVTGGWLLSPNTYSKFVEEGKIEDRLK